MANFTSYYASFGSSQVGLATVGYEQVGLAGATLVARTTVGVYEVGGGVYGVDIVLSAGCRSLLWDTGATTPIFATEDMMENFIKQAIINKRHTDPGTGQQTIFEEADDATVMVQGDIFEDSSRTSQAPRLTATPPRESIDKTGCRNGVPDNQGPGPVWIWPRHHVRGNPRAGPRDL